MTLDKLATALIEAQSEMKHAHLDSVNPHFRSKFASLKSVIDATRPVLAKHGLVIVQTLEACTDMPGTITVRTRLLHKSGQSIESSCVLHPKDAGPQATGSAITYGRRYGLAAICGIAADEDDDGAGAERVGKQQPRRHEDSGPPPDMYNDAPPPEDPNNMTEKQSKTIWAISCALWPGGREHTREKLSEYLAASGRSMDELRERSMSKGMASTIIKALDAIKGK